MYIKPEDCPSTHGGAGYSFGSYWEGEDIVCGLCGTRIHNPVPTGYMVIKLSLFRRIFFKEKEKTKPTYPDFIRRNTSMM